MKDGIEDREGYKNLKVEHGVWYTRGARWWTWWIKRIVEKERQRERHNLINMRNSRRPVWRRHNSRADNDGRSFKIYEGSESEWQCDKRYVTKVKGNDMENKSRTITL